MSFMVTAAGAIVVAADGVEAVTNLYAQTQRIASLDPVAGDSNRIATLCFGALFSKTPVYGNR